MANELTGLAVDSDSSTGAVLPSCFGCTTPEEREADAKAIVKASSETKAVFPEIPFLSDHMYVKFRDLNSNSKSFLDDAVDMDSENRRPHPAVEVGLKFTF